MLECAQVTENEALRSKLKMQAHNTGVLVTMVASQGPEAGVRPGGGIGWRDSGDREGEAGGIGRDR